MNRRGFLGWAAGCVGALLGLRRLAAPALTYPEILALDVLISRVKGFGSVFVQEGVSQVRPDGCGHVSFRVDVYGPITSSGFDRFRKAMLAPIRHPVAVSWGGVRCRMMPEYFDVDHFSGRCYFMARLVPWTEDA